MWPERLSLKIGKVLYNPIEHCCIMPGVNEVTKILDQLEPLQARLESIMKQVIEDEKNRNEVVATQKQELKDVRSRYTEMKQANTILKKDLAASQTEVHDRGNKLAELQKEIGRLKEVEAKWLEISKHFP